MKIFTANDRAKELGLKNHRDFIAVNCARSGQLWGGVIDDKATPLHAEVIENRWMVRCECFEYCLVEPLDPIHFCSNCGNVLQGGKARPVIFPDNMGDIEAELQKREWIGSPEIFDKFGTQTLIRFPSLVQHKHLPRNWKPGQSAKDLRDELAKAKKDGARTIHFSRTAWPTVGTGDSWSASQHNTYGRDNDAEYWKYTTAGDIVQAATSSTLSRLAIGSAYQLLRANAGATAVEYGQYQIAKANYQNSTGHTYSTNSWRDMPNSSSTITTVATSTVLAIGAVGSYGGSTFGFRKFKFNIDGTDQDSYITEETYGISEIQSATIIGYKTGVTAGSKTIKIREICPGGNYTVTDLFWIAIALPE